MKFVTQAVNATNHTVLTNMFGMLSWTPLYPLWTPFGRGPVWKPQLWMSKTNKTGIK